MRILMVGGLTTGRLEASDFDRSTLEAAGREIGRQLASRRFDSIRLCSPFQGSLDLEIARGIAEIGQSNGSPRIHLTYPNTPDVVSQLGRFEHELGLNYETRPVSVSDEGESSWLLWLNCQLLSLDESDVVFALGGRRERGASLLLSIAEAWGKTIVPAKYLGGAAGLFFDRLRPQWTSSIVAVLSEPSRVNEVPAIIDQLARPTRPNKTKPFIFLSYPRARSGEADSVEAVLRRRQAVTVYRDESDLRVGSNLSREIKQAIYEADIFLALYGREYVTSSNCFDELDEALDLRTSGDKPELWILRLDDTDIIPRRARERSELDPLTERIEDRPGALAACVVRLLQEYMHGHD